MKNQILKTSLYYSSHQFIFTNSIRQPKNSSYYVWRKHRSLINSNAFHQSHFSNRLNYFSPTIQFTCLRAHINYCFIFVKASQPKLTSNFTSFILSKWIKDLLPILKFFSLHFYLFSIQTQRQHSEIMLNLLLSNKELKLMKF